MQIESMTTVVDRLATLDDLRACETLQQSILGQHARSIWAVPSLAAIQRAGGLLLGAWESSGDPRVLQGAIVDLVAEADGYPSRFTAFRGVAEAVRGRGIAHLLRVEERAVCRQDGVDLVHWWLDPLRSNEAHVAFNKLGAIATGYQANVYGVLHDRANSGLATDRFRVEWWLESPRVSAILDHARRPPHSRLGFHQMEVLTQTRALPCGERALIGVNEEITERYVLAEIPANLDRLRSEDAAASHHWRLETRELFARLFDQGYIVVGFVHEGGRSFHLLERSDRGSVLGAA
jgi:predicted GNAT superfamily acetyltransferase